MFDAARRAVGWACGVARSHPPMDPSCVRQAVGPVCRRAFVVERAVAALQIAVLDGPAGFDAISRHVMLVVPRVEEQAGALVHAGPWAMLQGVPPGRAMPEDGPIEQAHDDPPVR